MIGSGITPRDISAVPLPTGPPDSLEIWLVSPSTWPSEDITRLDAREQRRAASFRRATDRATYVAAHTALRALAGAYLGRETASISYVREDCPGCGAPHGRPALAGLDLPLHFSLSHTTELALVAFASRPVGVDIEAVPAPEAVGAIAASFHPVERSELAGLRGSERSSAAARCWTRKEAYVKGTGEGVSSPGFAGVLVGTGTTALPVSGWSLTDVRVPAGFAGACALRTIQTSAPCVAAPGQAAC